MLPTATVHCPYCGESIQLLIDDSIEEQRYIEDCQVCCRPIRVAVDIVDGELQVGTAAENE
ncbi:CPXCG motif-containing cysteine-rich protein [Lysobacter sp. A286]